MTWPRIVTAGRRVGLVIPTWNCQSTVSIAIHVARAQTIRPRILVVDDGSSDDTVAVAERLGVDVLRATPAGGNVVGGCCWRPKRLGFQTLVEQGCDYVHSLDADGDYIPPTYTQTLVETIEADCRVGVAYPQAVQFGEKIGAITPGANLDDENWIVSTSLMRADALLQIGGWPADLPNGCYCDWSAWRRMRRLGWRLESAPTEYYYRRTAGSLSRRRQRTPGWPVTLDPQGAIAVAIPTCGRESLTDVLAAVAAQDLDAPLALYLLDNSTDGLVSPPTFARPRSSLHVLRDSTAARSGWSNAAVADGQRADHAFAVNHRVAGAWNRLLASITEPLIWCLEDDVIPPPTALRRLLVELGRADAVSGCYPARGGETNVMTWADVSGSLRPVRQRRGVGAEQAGAVGFGCVLMKKSLVERLLPARSHGSAQHGFEWFDWNFWADAARVGAKVVVDWDIECRHMGVDA